MKQSIDKDPYDSEEYKLSMHEGILMERERERERENLYIDNQERRYFLMCLHRRKFKVLRNVIYLSWADK
jgi:hypothetical protein